MRARRWFTKREEVSSRKERPVIEEPRGKVLLEISDEEVNAQATKSWQGTDGHEAHFQRAIESLHRR